MEYCKIPWNGVESRRSAALSLGRQDADGWAAMAVEVLSRWADFYLQICDGQNRKGEERNDESGQRIHMATANARVIRKILDR